MAGQWIPILKSSPPNQRRHSTGRVTVAPMREILVDLRIAAVLFSHNARDASAAKRSFSQFGQVGQPVPFSSVRGCERRIHLAFVETVSYTHLTLPTILLV